MKNKKKQIVVMILLVLSLVLVTVGVTYAFFRYAKEGSTENTLTTGTIEFLYTEVDKVGAGISIENAFPISDSKGKLLTGSGNIFNFKITSKVSGDMDIPYTVTAKTKDGSELDPKVVRLYLTDTTGDVEKELLLDNYSNLDSYNNNVEEKIIYEGLVPTGSTNYEKTFALRMWVASDADFSDGSLNGKTFTITVNVYSNAKVVTDADIDMANTTEINTLSLNNSEVEEIEGLEYDYEEVLPEGTTNASLDIETLSPDAQVSVEKVDSVAYNTSSIKRLSTKKTLDLNNGDNYFKIKVTNANKTETKEYTLKLTVGYSTLSKTIDEVINKFDSSTLKESIMCNMIENGSNTYYHKCKVYDTVSSAIDSRNKGIVILTNDIKKSFWIYKTKDLVFELNGYDITENGSAVFGFEAKNGKLKIQDRTGESYIYHANYQAINIGENSEVVIDGVNIKRLEPTETISNRHSIWLASKCDGCKLTINDIYIEETLDTTLDQNTNCKNAIITINNGEFYSKTKGAIYLHGSNNVININNGKFSSTGSHAIINYSTNGVVNINGGEYIGISSGSTEITYNSTIVNSSTGTINISGNTQIKNLGQSGWSNCGIHNDNTNGIININGENAIFDSNGNYQSGIYVYTTKGQGIRNGGTLKINGVTVESGNNSVTNTLDTSKTYIINGIFNKQVRNEKAGTIKICGGEINNSSSENLANDSTGYIYYNSNVILKNNTIKDTNTPSHVILDDTLTCSE